MIERLFYFEFEFSCTGFSFNNGECNLYYLTDAAFELEDSLHDYFFLNRQLEQLGNQQNTKIQHY